jgi:hypothetical protein
VIYVNPLGCQQDFLWHNGGWDVNFDFYFESVGRETADGFEVEIAVPFRSLSYDSGDDQTWGVIFLRSDPAVGVHYSWPHTPDPMFVDPRLLQNTADLVGVRPPDPGVGVEAIGTLTGVQRASRGEDGELAWSGVEPWYEAARPGAEVRLRLKPSVELAAVANPDFSDVESDATQFDLNQRFTWQRPENRDFFNADANRFSDELATLYTRGMVQPLYGLRLAGVAGPATFGMINVLDRAPSWSLDWDGTPGWSEEDVQGAMAATSFARMKVRIDNSDLGVVAANKRLIGGSGATNTVNGADLRVPLSPRLFFFGGAQGSVTTDAQGQAYSGHRALAGFANPSGAGWRWLVSGLDVSEDFRAETAFLTDTGLTEVNAYLERFMEPGAAAIDSVIPRVTTYTRLDRDGEKWLRQEASAVLYLNSVHKLEGRVQARDLRLNVGDSGRMYKGALSYSQIAVARVSYEVGAEYGQDWHWGYSAVALGGVGYAGLTLRTRANLFLDTRLTGAWTDPEDEARETGVTFRTNATWQFAPWGRLRIIEEVGDNTAWGERWVSSSALLHLQARVRTEAFFGYTERRDLTRGQSQEHIVFAKLSGNFRR